MLLLEEEAVHFRIIKPLNYTLKHSPSDRGPVS
jgi:hypothetical protein